MQFSEFLLCGWDVVDPDKARKNWGQTDKKEKLGWQLLTAVLGEVFYLGADATLKSIKEKGVSDYNLDLEEQKEWIKLLDTYDSKKKCLVF